MRTQPRGVRPQAARAHLAGPLTAVAVAVAAGRPVFWAGLAAPVASALVYPSVRRRWTFGAEHARSTTNAHLSIARYLAATAAVAFIPGLLRVAGPLLPVAPLATFALYWLLFVGIAASRAARGLVVDNPLAVPFVGWRR